MKADRNDSREPSSDRPELHSSLTLLERARAGDREALESLIARYLPRLQRWASGRLPRWARDMAETQDLVQEALFQTFKRIERFEPGAKELCTHTCVRPSSIEYGRSFAARSDGRPEVSSIQRPRTMPGRRSQPRSDRKPSTDTSGRLRNCGPTIANWSLRGSNWAIRTARSPNSSTSRLRMRRAWPRSAPSSGSPRRWERRTRDRERTCPARRRERPDGRRPDRLGVRRVEGRQ